MFDWLTKTSIDELFRQGIVAIALLVMSAFGTVIALLFDSRQSEPIDYLIYTLVGALLLSGIWALSGFGYRYFYGNAEPAKGSSSGPSPSEPNKARIRDEFEKETVYLSDLVNRPDNYISHKKLRRTLIKGPGILRLHRNVQVRFCTTSERPDTQLFMVVDPGTAAPGCILVTDATFDQCHFEGVTILGTSKDRENLIEGFSQLSTADWQSKFLKD